MKAKTPTGLTLIVLAALTLAACVPVPATPAGGAPQSAAGRADALMTAHIFNANLDPNLPATVSKPTITGILRDQLGFDGVIISDDVQMGAIADHYGFETAIPAAIEAGVDILAIGNNSTFAPAIASRAIEVIKGLVRDGVVSEARIDQSYEQIMRLKARLP